MIAIHLSERAGDEKIGMNLTLKEQQELTPRF